ncbi:hypothetical protein C1H46_040027 [Malus baccata]|uniref:Uncharacterized protein n=1 Tax=Malus baccata TaxID=106549 RepID=A0A540KJT8_MALBA|nr:hypothetical protein C1H46_040027 [Malus baccata]
MPRYKDEPLAAGVYSVCDESRDSGESQLASHVTNPPLSRISSDQVQSSSEHLQDERASKKTRVDSRRRI